MVNFGFTGFLEDLAPYAIYDYQELITSPQLNITVHSFLKR